MTIYYGSVINPRSLTAYDALPRCLLAVGSNGTIDWIVEDVEDSMVQETMLQKGCVDEDVFPLANGQFIMPGFIDTHIVRMLPLVAHLITYALLSMHPRFLTLEGMYPHTARCLKPYPTPSGQQYELLDWLTNVTFPMEAKFSDVQLAERAYQSVVRRVIDSGVSSTSCVPVPLPF